MKLKLTRQHLETLSHEFIPVMLRFADVHIQDSIGEEEKMIGKLCRSLLCDIDIMFKRKLLTEANKFKLKFTEAHGIAFLQFLLNFPIPETQFWLQNLRQQIVHDLHKQII